MAIQFLSSLSVTGSVSVSSVAQDNSTYTGILVWDGSTLKYRTKAQILADIGAGTGSGTVTSVAISNGGGIGVSGSPITSSGTITLSNTDKGSSQNIFKNFAVSGQNTIVADSNNDIMTFVATGGMTITTNSSTDTITFNSANDNDNNFVSSVSFNTSTGVLTLNRSGLSALTVDLDGRYVEKTGDTMTGTLTMDGAGIIIDTDTAGSSLTWKESDSSTNAGQLRGYANRGDIYLYNNGVKLTEISSSTDSFIPALHIGGTTAATNKLNVTSSNDSTAVGIDIGSNASFNFAANSTSGYSTTFNMDDTGLDIGHDSGSRSLNLKTNSSDRMTILGNGNVGIGQVSPSNPLHVSSSVETIARFQSTDAGAKIRVMDDANSVFLGCTNSEVFIGPNTTNTNVANIRIATGNTSSGQAGYAGFGTTPSSGHKFRVAATNNTSSDATMTCITADMNVTGTSVLTGDRTSRGVFADIDSSASGGDTTNEVRLNAVEAHVTDTGDADLSQAVFGQVQQSKTNTLDSVTNIIGGRFSALADHSAGSISNAQGSFSSVRIKNSGTITALYANRNEIQTSASDADIPNAYGVYSRVEPGSSYTGTITTARAGYFEVESEANNTFNNAYAVEARIDHNAGTLTNAYQFRGQTQGTISGDNYGIYSTGAALNRIDGSFRLGSYGSGTYTGTSAYYLIADSSGNLIEKTPAQVRSDIGAGTGSGTVTSVAANTGITGGTITTSGTLKIDYTGTDSVIQSAPNINSITKEDTFIINSAEDNNVYEASIGSLGGALGVHSGSGTANTLAKWSGTSALTNSEITDTGTLVKIGSNTSGQETLYIDTQNRKVGFRTQTPGSAFDVNGTFRARNELNIGATTEQNFFVAGGSGPQYVKMGAYTKDANFLGIASSENLLKTTAGFGANGKVVQASRFYTTKIESGGWPTAAGFANGKALTPTPGSNQVMYIRNIFVNKSSTDVGTGWSTGTYPIEFGWLGSGSSASRFIGGIPRNVIISTNPNQWWYQVTINAESNNPYGTPFGPVANKPLLLNTPAVISSQKQPTMYIQVEYTLVNISNFRTNVDQTYT